MKLELFTGPGQTLADVMHAATQAEALEGIVKDAKQAVRTALEDKVNEVSASSGTAFTARHEGWTALITDPQPKPKVTDPEAFAAWFAEAYPDDVKVAPKVEVVDHVRASEGLFAFGAGDLQAAATLLGDSLKASEEVLLPEDPFKPLLDTGRCVATDDGLVDTETGEHVPGVVCNRAKAVLQLKGTPPAKAKARREVADKLGIPPELAGGDA